MPLSRGPKAQAANIKLRRLNAKYKEFSDAAGLPEQKERLKAAYSDNASIEVAERLKVQRTAEAPIRADIKSRKYPLTLNAEKQARHMAGMATAGRSVVTISTEELQKIINAKAGSGKILFQKEHLYGKSEKLLQQKRKWVIL